MKFLKIENREEKTLIDSALSELRLKRVKEGHKAYFEKDWFLYEELNEQIHIIEKISSRLSKVEID